jgi:hypothetical protein
MASKPGPLRVNDIDFYSPAQWSVPFVKMELGENLLVYTTFVIKA